MDALPYSGGNAWWINSRLQIKGEIPGYARASVNYQYSLATTSVTKAADADVLGIAVDDGRCGRQSWKLGSIIVPHKNFVAWLVPKA